MKRLKERSFYLHNFGCKVNQEEGAALAALFQAAGWRQTEGPEAGLIIVNTCTVTQVADKKARNLIRRFAKEQPSMTREASTLGVRRMCCPSTML